jgi:L-threonylcarbamoyladenylate synthase
MEIISNPTVDEIKGAARALKNGHLVAFPTETVYGLGADATNEYAVSRIYTVKSRPVNHPLIVHISSASSIENWATNIPDYAIKLAMQYWPGPMTLILPRKEIARNFITGGQSNVGLRVPSQTIALALLKEFEELGGLGIAAPSANRFGAVSPTTANAVEQELGAYFGTNDLVLDGGPCLIGIESTIIKCTEDKPLVLRPGAITRRMIQNTIGDSLEPIKTFETSRASGMFLSHYSPRANIVLNEKPNPGDGFIAIEEFDTPIDTVRLMAPIDSTQFAHGIYEAFRKADLLGLTKIVIIPPTGDDLCEAIIDRLVKSSGHS